MARVKCNVCGAKVFLYQATGGILRGRTCNLCMANQAQMKAGEEKARKEAKKAR